MNKLIKGLGAAVTLMAAAAAQATSMTWNDYYDAGTYNGPLREIVPEKINKNETTTWLHDITDAASNSFNAATDSVTSFSITLYLSDDGFFDGSEKAQLKIEGSNVLGSRDVPLIGFLNYNESSTISWLASLNDDGKLNLSLSSTKGDFFFFGSALQAEGNRNPASVPEPSSLALLAAGMVGLGLARRRAKAA